MENNNPYVPTIEELQKRFNQIEIDKMELESMGLGLIGLERLEVESKPKIILFEEVIRILKQIPDFHKFLTEKDFDDYELAYTLFGQVIRYLKYCHKKGNVTGIREMCEYLDNMAKNKNPDIQDLLGAGVLEVFDIHKEILPDIIVFMPENLKKIFVQHYGNYLN